MILCDRCCKPDRDEYTGVRFTIDRLELRIYNGYDLSISPAPHVCSDCRTELVEVIDKFLKTGKRYVKK